jgi:hypothetical protein
MSAQRWDKVELTASYTLLTILATELLTRLGLFTMFPLPPVDMVLSLIATVLVLSGSPVTAASCASGSSASPPPPNWYPW